jgi:hypothetical protein
MTDSLEALGAGRDPDPAATHPLLAPIRPLPLEDEPLREEIELLLDVIAIVADYSDHLTAEQVDAALQLPGRRDEWSTRRRAHGPPWKVSEPGGSPGTMWGSSTFAGQPEGAASSVMSDLFDPEPQFWSRKGNLQFRHVWSSMSSQLVARRMPPTREATERVLSGAFRAVVGIDPTPDPLPETSKQVYLLHVTDDVMFSGVVNVQEWKDRLIPLLLSRAAYYPARP